MLRRPMASSPNKQANLTTGANPQAITTDLALIMVSTKMTSGIRTRLNELYQGIIHIVTLTPSEATLQLHQDPGTGCRSSSSPKWTRPAV